MKKIQQVTDLQQVKSSNIESIAFHEETLFVQFKSGLYRYNKVPLEVYEEMKKSESKGKFMNSAIKGTYEFEKVELELKQIETAKTPEVPSVEQIKAEIMDSLGNK